MGRTVIVGPNNAGRSTVVEAIRVLLWLRIALRVSSTFRFERLTDPAGVSGATPSLRDLNSDLAMPSIRTASDQLQLRVDSEMVRRYRST